MQDPTRQYNGYETGFQLDPRNGKVLGPRNVNVYSEARGKKEQLTVLIMARADAQVMPPAIVYPCKRAVPKNIVDKVPEDFLVARSDSGRMTSDIFYEYMANCFILRLNVLLQEKKSLHPSTDLALCNDDWIDGYCSHLTLHVSQRCELNGSEERFRRLSLHIFFTSTHQRSQKCMLCYTSYSHGKERAGAS